MDATKKLNEILVSLFNSVLKMEEAAVKESSRHHLSITEIHTLDAIGIGKAKTMTQVAGILKISVSTLTVAINKLVTKGYVKRYRVSEDRRIVKIELTEEGADAVAEHEQFHLSMINDAIGDLDHNEKSLLIQSLDSINEFFKKQRIKPIRGDGPFELSPMKLGDLEIPVPIWQGGMGIGVSLWQLASAVSKCGGVGIISGEQTGFSEADYEENPVEANVRAIKKQVKKAREAVRGIPGRGPIGVNIVCSDRHADKYVTAAIDGGAELIISGTGLSTTLPASCKNSKVKLVPIVSSARAAAVIIKAWAKKYNRTPDAMIFEGVDAGGYLSYKEEQLENAKNDFYQTILEIKGEIQNLQNCPLLVGGGIYTKEDVQRALAYGVDGVVLGTRFVTTEECDVNENYKKAYLNCGKEDIVILQSPLGMPMRVLKNSLLERIEKNQLSVTDCTNCMKTCGGKEAAYCIRKGLLQSALGDVENGIVFCGSNAYRATRLERVAEIFEELK